MLTCTTSGCDEIRRSQGASLAYQTRSPAADPRRTEHRVPEQAHDRGGQAGDGGKPASSTSASAPLLP